MKEMLKRVGGIVVSWVTSGISSIILLLTCAILILTEAATHLGCRVGLMRGFGGPS